MGDHQVQLNSTTALSVVLIASVISIAQVDLVAAQSSLGLGRSEQAIQPEGMFAGVLLWIQQQQQSFYKSMTAALSAMKSDPANIWVLVGLSFLYGVFHAAGPGHGKAVISSYMIANEVAARRGILLSFVSALLQGVTAIVAIGLLLLVLRGSGIRSSDLSGFLEISSYFLVMMLGLYLLWRKVWPTKTAHSLNVHHHHDHSHHDHGDDLVCSTCGHSHAADPKQLEGDVGLREAWSAILAVGIRPCSGALIVLTFAFLNGLYAGGVLSTLAMSIGTGITVSALALMAVGAKNAALKFSGMQDRAASLNRIIEIGGAGLVFLLGLVLFSAALAV